MKLSPGLPSPALVVDLRRLDENIDRMQRACAASSVELWPHVKTHKCINIARRQLERGATGLTCAKLSEAEAMLPSGVKRIFLAHSLASAAVMDRAASLQRKLKQLVLAVTSVAHARVLARLAHAGQLAFPVALAVDTGLGREGLRTLEEAEELARFLRGHPELQPFSIYTHEGHAYGTTPDQRASLIEATYTRCLAFREVLGKELPLWPGCSVTAAAFAGKPGVGAVRPGAYVFGDLFLSEMTGNLRQDEIALSIRATVVDRPARDLALIDAGSKTFSSDRLPNGIFARPQDGRDFSVTRLSEEHGFITGPEVDSLQIGETVNWIPAHVCPAVNLARYLHIVTADGNRETWGIEASGCNY